MRALLQAKLNYLLEVGVMLGDPDAAGAPPKPATKPADASDYEGELSLLKEQISQERPGGYAISENRAKYFIILHCRAIKDTYPLMALQTDEENKVALADAATERPGPTSMRASRSTTRRRLPPIARRRSNTACRRRPIDTAPAPC